MFNQLCYAYCLKFWARTLILGMVKDPKFIEQVLLHIDKEDRLVVVSLSSTGTTRRRNQLISFASDLYK